MVASRSKKSSLTCLRISWKEREMLKNWKDANIMQISKKSNHRDCENCRGISLLCIALMIMARETV